MKNFTDYIVDIDALKNNIKNIKSHLKKNIKFCAVVKGNAYGLGVNTVCSALFGIADYFAVASLKEALEIRVFDKKTKVLILGKISINDIDICAENNIDISVGNLFFLEDIVNSTNCDINIHLQINTGLNRFGFSTVTEYRKALKLINDNDNIHLEGVYSHFATKANDQKFIKKQYLKFIQFKNITNDDSVIFHIANSFATVNNYTYHCNMVRNGFLMYGMCDNKFNNKPVLSIVSHIVGISEVKKGATIGYDRTYKCTRSMKVAVVPVGYADGFDRRLSNNFSVLIGGKKCLVVGLVCMDVFMVDVSSVDNVRVGDEVVLLGSQGNQKITLDNYATAMNTSPYEVMLKFSYKRMNYIVNKNT